MGSLYRSEVMSLCQLFVPSEAAYSCVAELGELGLAQFRDLNSEQNPYQRKFVSEVRRCDEMDRKLRFIDTEIIKEVIEVDEPDDLILAPLPRDLTTLETKFEQLEESLISFNANIKQLRENFAHLANLRSLLQRVRLLLDEGGGRSTAQATIAEQSAEFEDHPLLQASEKDKERAKEENELRFVAGVIDREKAPAFERVLWRISRGKVYVRLFDITEPFDPLVGVMPEKVAFALFFSGEQLKTRVRKVCDGFRATVYPVSEEQGSRAQLFEQVSRQLEDMRAVLGKTCDLRRVVLVAAAHNARTWSIQVLKMKAIYHTLNMFSVDVTQKCLIAECWVPSSDLALVKQALERGQRSSGAHVSVVLHELHTHDTHPTYHKLNKFTRGFQNIVDSYGIANYGEINPAPWTIISFPFLFAVMFGDAGHGTIMLLAALSFIVFEKRLEAMKIKDEIFNTFFGGRYVVLLMGLFAIYTGLIYNDIFSKSINFFGSRWVNPYTNKLLNDTELAGIIADQTADLTMDPGLAFKHSGGPYPFGVDPIWNLAKNKLNFLNPMKMKSSVIIGIVQMTFGVLLSFANYIHRRSALDILFMFIPQMLFLGCIFIYLCIQIIVKWIVFWVEPKDIFGEYYPSSNCAPSLLIGLINMFMLKSRKVGFATLTNGTYVELDQCYLQQWYPHQGQIEMILLFVAVVAIPVMLLVKPLVLQSRASRGIDVSEYVHSEGGHDEGFSFADVLVYQAIHTIEFALGCISHTASYLRLWALSLAHAELSEVLWQMVLHIALSMGGWGGAGAMWVIFWAFGILSVCILILMEGLSAFLHALRLHWVEFQSKFYLGTGIQFEPFSFVQLQRLAEGLEN